MWSSVASCEETWNGSVYVVEIVGAMPRTLVAAASERSPLDRADSADDVAAPRRAG